MINIFGAILHGHLLTRVKQSDLQAPLKNLLVVVIHQQIEFGNCLACHEDPWL